MISSLNVSFSVSLFKRLSVYIVPRFKLIKCATRSTTILFWTQIHPDEIEKENAFHRAGTDYQDS